ncbi:MAG: ABC transporter permease [Bacteroidales bacterium]|jgi:ABC-2 type transport system permease protein|nr:ABC transporter permease [Bacteroidales bacterium]MDI9591533.1 ABC transporter permease [Bacteroidota bacterium]HOF80374.1 ABC transporter permease [Bacteroidales bacterium]HOR75527.1 ABC transporter permease [Bacteroidales bacterium]HPL11047.1 ABC transporter permease [Bacteroidales bacterium]
MIRLAVKDLRLFFRDRRSMILTFAIPIVLMTIFAFAFGGVGKTRQSNKITLLVSDLDNTPLSKKAILQLDSLKSIQLQVVTLEEAEESIKKGNRSCVLVIHIGFSDSLIKGAELPLELRYDEARGIEVGLIQQSLVPTIAMLPFNLLNSKQMIGNRLARMAGINDPKAKEAIKTQSDHLYDAISDGILRSGKRDKVNIASNFMGGDIKMTKLVRSTNDNQLGLIQAVAGTAVMWLLFSVVGVGMSLLDEKHEGTLTRLLYTPTNPVNILFSKMISANVISILQLLIMFLFASLAFGLEIYSNLGGMLINIIATAFACSSFGILLASLAKNRSQVQGLSILIILVMSAIGGSMIPLIFMPSFMQKIAVVSVNYWSIQGFYDIFWRNFSIFNPTFISRISVLILIGIILNILAVIMFKKNILKLT